MSTRLLHHAHKRLSLATADTPALRLAAGKRFLRLEDQMLRMRHRAGEGGQRIAQARAGMIDALLQRLVAAFSAEMNETSSALIALGGYGRQELCPLSDIDLMFLHADRVKPARAKEVQQKLYDGVIMLLWDMDLKVGYSFRSIEEAFAEARKNMQTKTSLLEARFVAGIEETFKTFDQAYRNFYRKEDPKGYIATRLEDQAQRRARHGDTVFLQEPDIKNGVGGLRDYQNALWMARVKLGVTTMEELCEMKYLRTEELRKLKRAYNFLLRVRIQLHFESRKASDVLILEKQATIAQQLGYTQPDDLDRVEHFMRDYYRAAQIVFRTTRLLEHRLSLTNEPARGAKVSFKDLLLARRREPSKHLDGFVLRGKELAAENSKVFEEDPARMVRVFRHAQQLNAHLDFELENLVRVSLPLLTRKICQTVDACRSFRAILEDAGRVYPALSAMHEAGVLGRFLPEFDHLTCLVQHELYHRYTADVHTLNTIKELDNVLTSPDPMYSRYRTELRATPSPNLLYVTLLLHDIGKGAGIENHSESGVRMADPVLARLEFEESQRAVVRFLIKNHLTMARFWQKYDLDDPHTTAAFADLVGDAERLRLLYVHTFCDARSTSTTLWNGYKDTLHTTLFRNTIEFLSHGAAVEHHSARQFEMTKKDLLSRDIPGVDREETLAHFSLMPERYFIHTDNDEIALHLQMVNRLLKTIVASDTVSTLQPIIDWRDDLSRSLTVVNIVTWDRAGLFYKLAGAFSLAGLNILGAKIFSRSDHIAIDTFYIVEPGRGVVQSQRVMDQFQGNVHQTLISNKDLYPDIEVQARKHQTRLLSDDRNPLLASFTPKIDVYHELSLKRTIVEIQAPDQIGLLYRIAKAIYDHGFDITFARINTERGLAIDTFYIENANKDAVAEPNRLVELRENLNRIVSPEHREAVHY